MNTQLRTWILKIHIFSNQKFHFEKRWAPSVAFDLIHAGECDTQMKISPAEVPYEDGVESLIPALYKE